MLALADIYIENQYAISNMGEGAAYNRVCEAILRAVERNLTAGRDFKVYFVIPDKCVPPFASCSCWEPRESLLSKALG